MANKRPQEPPAMPPEDAKGGEGTTPLAVVPGDNTAGGSTVKSKTEAEALEGSPPFELNQRQPVPPDFRAAYQRRALIVVEVIKAGPRVSVGVSTRRASGPSSSSMRIWTT